MSGRTFEHHGQAEGDLLPGGDTSVVRRVGDTVVRSAGFWTPTVHTLLRHLEEAGFDGAPRVIAHDEAGGAETLTFIEGDTPLAPYPAWMMTDDVLVDLARLARRFHEAVASFVPPPGAQWRRWVGNDDPEGEIIGFTDWYPPNIVFREGRPVAMIDWDFAQPFTRVHDMAGLVKMWVPLMADARMHSEGWPADPDGSERARRLRVACDAYGLGPTERARLLDAVLDNNHRGYDTHVQWTAAGVPGFAQMWADGSGDKIMGDRRWLLDHWGDLAHALA